MGASQSIVVIDEEGQNRSISRFNQNRYSGIRLEQERQTRCDCENKVPKQLQPRRASRTLTPRPSIIKN